MFRPGPVTGFHVEAAAPWDEGRNASLDQQSLLAVRRARRLEQIPYAFSFSYRCEDAACSGHRQQMIDWELGQNYRNTNGFDEARRLELVRERWLDQVCRADRETFFFAGNHSQHPGSFMLLGAFWPRKRELQRLERPELALF